MAKEADSGLYPGGYVVTEDNKAADAAGAGDEAIDAYC